MRLMTYRILTADPLGIADVRPRTANATVLARGWSMFSNALSAASDKGVDKLWIVHTVLVDDEAADQSAELQKGVPIAAIAG